MIWSISWKNVWRSKLRSLVIIAAIVVGLAGGILSVAIFKGMEETRTYNIIKNEVSHLQIHHPKFGDNFEPDRYISGLPEIEKKLQNADSSIRISKRLKAFSFARTDRGSGGLIVNGIFPEDEKQVTGISEMIYDSCGAYLSKADGRYILISTTTAEDLKIDYYLMDSVLCESFKADLPESMHSGLDSLSGKRFHTKKLFLRELSHIYGNHQADEYKKQFYNYFRKFNMRKKISLSFLDVNMENVGMGFRIAGIYKTTNTSFDGMNAYVGFEKLKELMSMPDNTAHEIAGVFSDKEIARKASGVIAKQLPDLLVEDWSDIRPEIKMQADMMEVSMLIIIIIILMALGFGIVNTMLMAILERVREFGMLMAVGMSRKRVFFMVVLETVFLSFTGGVIGIVISALLVAWVNQTGIDISAVAQGMEAMGYSAILYPSISLQFYVMVAGLVIVTGILASIYPAIKALKLKPASAIRAL